MALFLLNQQSNNDCGICCAAMLVNHYENKKIELSEFKYQNHYQQNELSFFEIQKILKKYNVESESYFTNDFNEIINLNFPILVDVKTKTNENHYIILEKYKNERFLIVDPDKSEKYDASMWKIFEIMNGNLMIFLTKKSKGTKKTFDFKKKLIFHEILVKNFLSILTISLINFFSLVCFLSSNMFLKTLLTNFSYLNQVFTLKITLMFVVFAFLWASFSIASQHLKQLISKKQIEKHFIKFSKEKIGFSNFIKSLNSKQGYNNFYNYYLFYNYWFNIFVDFIALFLLMIVVCITFYYYSITLLFASVLLILILSLIKFFKQKQIVKHKNLLLQNNFDVSKNLYKAINNLEIINNKNDFKSYLNSKSLKKPYDKTFDLNMYFSLAEKILIYLYYGFIFLILNFQNFDISTFLVFTNIIFLIEFQIESLIGKLIGQKGCHFSLFKSQIAQFVYLPEMVVTYFNLEITSKVLWIKKSDLNKILIDYKKINYFLENNEVFDSNKSLIDYELISNIIFNFGAIKSLEFFSKINVNKYLTENGFDLSMTLNLKTTTNKQKSLLRILSGCFCKQELVIFYKKDFDDFKFLQSEIEKYLQKRLLIYVEE